MGGLVMWRFGSPPEIGLIPSQYCFHTNDFLWLLGQVEALHSLEPMHRRRLYGSMGDETVMPAGINLDIYQMHEICRLKSYVYKIKQQKI